MRREFWKFFIPAGSAWFLLIRNKCDGGITWNGVDLKQCDFPVYLGVTLDRTLSYKQHIEKWKAKWEQGTTSSISSQVHHGAPILSLYGLPPLHSAIQLQNMPVLCGKDHPMQRKSTPPLMTVADASLAAWDLQMLTAYMSWLESLHLAFADQ